MAEELSTRRAKRSFSLGLSLLVAFALIAVGVIAWGIGGSSPAARTQVEVAEVQFAQVKLGTLIETTKVQGTASRGTIISLSVPNIAGQGSQAAQASSVGTQATAPTTAPVPTTLPTISAPPATTTTTSAVEASTSTTPTTAASGSPTSIDSTTTLPTSTTQPVSTPPPTAPSAAAPTTTASAPATTAPRATPTAPTTAIGGAAVPSATSGATSSVNSSRVITSLPNIGTVLKAGDPAFAIDGRPSIMVGGAVPAWRAIDEDTTDGVDVEQLEAFLDAGGFADSELVVDQHVTAETISAINSWQESLDLVATGRVELGEVIFHDGDVTVVALNAKAGAVVSPGENLLDVRSGDPFVDVSTDASWAATGAKVKVNLGGGTSATGTVASFSAGIAHVVLPVDTAVRDGSTATVTLSRNKVANTLLVPAASILVSDLHGATVTVRTRASTKAVAVRVLASANGTAAIEPVDGSVTEGLEVATY